MPVVEFNINGHVLLKVTDAGRPYAPRLARADQDGFIKMQLWQVIQDFGHLIYLGCEPPFETTIRIELPDGKLQPLTEIARSGLVSLSRFQDMDDDDPEF